MAFHHLLGVAGVTAPSSLTDQATTDWAAWITAIGTATTTMILLITAVVAYFGIRDARRTRHGQLVTDLSRQFNEASLAHSLELYGKYEDEGIVNLVERLFGDNDHTPTTEELDDYGALSLSANYFETVGVLVKERAVTSSLVYDLLGGPIMDAWAAWEDAINRLSVSDDPRETGTYEHFRSLAATMRGIGAARELGRGDNA